MLMWILIGVGVVIVVLAAWSFLRRRGGSDKIVSIVVLRKSPKGLTEADVRGAVRRALKVEVEVHSTPMPDGKTTAYIVVGEGVPPVGIIDSRRPYFGPEDIASTESQFEDQDARRAMREHTSWLSIDAMGLDRLPDKETRYTIYNKLMGPLIAEFLDDASMLTYLPAEGRVGRADSETARKLAAGDCGGVFGEDDVNAPMFHVENDDKDVEAAKREARERLPEFLRAAAEPGRSEPALVKSAFRGAKGTEFMWSVVQSVDASGVRAEVANPAVQPDLPKKGTVVTVALDDIVDWMYVGKDKQPQGMFVDRVLVTKKKRG
ncbi:MAG TPA: DUF2314 domain-containing protein [Phycisphaerales bacterium]|nr:DUF2314 domain-containing protein [Phycisphaerales bacterium]